MAATATTSCQSRRPCWEETGSVQYDVVGRQWTPLNAAELPQFFWSIEEQRGCSTRTGPWYFGFGCNVSFSVPVSIPHLVTDTTEDRGTRSRILGMVVAAHSSLCSHDSAGHAACVRSN
uniref:Uncharacterized protein n=1 Tax=Eutreptiella gymnastica TaxID=73025 RepID=A0A7S4CDE9_9EUGL